MIRNLTVLRELGVPEELLFSRLLFGDKQSVCCDKEIFDESLKKVVDMGFDPTTSKLVDALHAFRSMSDETMEEKVNVYKSLGFDEEDVWAMFKKWPKFLSYSEDKITRKFDTLDECGLVQDQVWSVFNKFPQCMGFSNDDFATMVTRYPWFLNLSPFTVEKKTEFLVKEMNWPIQALVSNPQVLGYSMEKRIVPMCNVIKALMTRGLMAI
ncbi:hypothetical protein EUTSA_v10024025mg, partial [Eutrema salsugineum]